MIANTKKTAYTDKKRTPGTVYRYLVKAYGVSLNKKVIYGQVSNCASAVTKPQTPKITSVKKDGTTKAAIQLKTERNVKDINSMSTCGRRRSLNLLERLRVKNTISMTVKRRNLPAIESLKLYKMQRKRQFL